MSILASLNTKPLDEPELDLVMPAYQVLKRIPAGTKASEAIDTVCRVLHEPQSRIKRVLAYITKGLVATEY